MRHKTIAPKRLTQQEVRDGELLDASDDQRPVTRGDCLSGGFNEARPCPFMSCKYHLALDVNPSGSLVVYDLEAAANGDLSRMEHSCVLDLADRGGMTLEEVGDILGVTRERIRQVEVKALVLLRLGGLGDDR
jgi:hypothetical protein